MYGDVKFRAHDCLVRIKVVSIIIQEYVIGPNYAQETLVCLSMLALVLTTL